MPFGWFSRSGGRRNELPVDDSLGMGDQHNHSRLVALNADSYRSQIQKPVDASPWLGDHHLR